MTESVGIVSLTCDAVEVIGIAVKVVKVFGVVVEFVACVLVELTVAGAAVGLMGLLFADTSFFMGTSFGCFTTFLAVVVDDAKINMM